MNAVDLIGYLAALLGTAAFVPQVFMTVRRRSARDISLAAYVLFCSGVSLWLIYALLQRSGPLIAAKSNLPGAEFTGVLSGESLARAYARMNVFVFPSETETFGNVVLEALASGVPAVVTSKGGPQFIVERSISGFVAVDSAEFALHVATLISDTEQRERMGSAARSRSEQWSWEAMMDAMYCAFRQAIELAPRPSRFAALPAGPYRPVEQR